MPASVIAHTGDFRDPEALERYRRGNTEAVAHHGGRFIARSGAVEVLERPRRWERCVVMEFPPT